MDLLIGADVGGTTSRVVACETDGTLKAFSSAAGGNIRSSGAAALDHVFEAIGQVLEDAGPGRVIGAHLGIAGAGAAKYEDIRASCVERGVRLGIDAAALAVTTDLETAFAACSSEGEGLLLLAGTGAVAAVFLDYQVVGRCDGLGWLLGDEGSGTWIGLRALQSVARSIDHRGTETSLTEPVLRALSGQDGRDAGDGDHAGTARHQAHPVDVRQQMIADAYRLQPAAFASLAPLVVQHAADGDPVSQGIVAEAAAALARCARGAVADAYGDGAPPAGVAVLAGGLLGVGGQLHDRVSDALNIELPMMPVVPDAAGAPPVVGALRLAARRAGVPADLVSLRRAVLERTPFT